MSKKPVPAPSFRSAHGRTTRYDDLAAALRRRPNEWILIDSGAPATRAKALRVHLRRLLGTTVQVEARNRFIDHGAPRCDTYVLYPKETP